MVQSSKMYTIIASFLTNIPLTDLNWYWLVEATQARRQYFCHADSSREGLVIQTQSKQWPETSDDNQIGMSWG